MSDPETLPFKKEDPYHLTCLVASWLAGRNVQTSDFCDTGPQHTPFPKGELYPHFCQIGLAFAYLMTQGTEVSALLQQYIGNGEAHVPRIHTCFAGTPRLQTTILHPFVWRRNASGNCIDGDLSNARPKWRVFHPNKDIVWLAPGMHCGRLGPCAPNG